MSDPIWFEKDKDARLNYGFTVAEVIAPADRLASVTCTASPSDLLVESIAFSGSNITAVISGGAVNTWYALAFRWVSATGLTDQFVARVFVPPDQELVAPVGSALFPNRFAATAALRRDRLVAAAAVLPNAEFSDDYLWEKLVAAEADLAMRLGVPLVPTKFFPEQPTDTELAALGAMPWGIDPGYDQGPGNFAGDRWGLVTLRNAPLISIERYRFAYPSSDSMVYDLPLSWLRADNKRGMVNVVPTSYAAGVPLSSIVMQALAGGRTVPLMLQVTYVAGLANVPRDWPQILDLVKKMAVLKCVEDSFLPQSGSISADGLSQSLSIDMDKYRDTIDYAINGPKGSNGGLMTAIHGVRGLVL